MHFTVPSHHLYDDYSVVVSAFARAGRGATDMISVKFFVEINFRSSDDPENLFLAGYSKSGTFILSHHVLCCGDVKRKLSSAIKLMGVPFGFSNLHCKGRLVREDEVNSSGALQASVPLANEDEMLDRILHFVVVSEAQNLGEVSVNIVKDVVIPKKDFLEWYRDIMRERNVYWNTIMGIPQLELDKHVQTTLRWKKISSVLKKGIDWEDGDVCPICLLELEKESNAVSKTPCSHVYHWDCITKWLINHTNCPKCRHELIDKRYYGDQSPFPVRIL